MRYSRCQYGAPRRFITAYKCFNPPRPNQVSQKPPSFLKTLNPAKSISGGHAADRLGRLNALYHMVTLCGVFCLAMWLPAKTTAVLVGFTCVYGFASGIFISVMPAATAQITPTERLGVRLGAFGSVTSVAFLTGLQLQDL